MFNIQEALNKEIKRITDYYKIVNIQSLDNVHDPNGYWQRFANLSFFRKLRDDFNYHFLYEIQGLSNQIHFGIATSYLFRNYISEVLGRPNEYNHRFTYSLESSIHGIYAYWNRVANGLNTYLKNPYPLKKVYFDKVVRQLAIDYPEIETNEYYNWLKMVGIELNNLQRNEFAHNNSLIMQQFFNSRDNLDFIKDLPDRLLNNNRHIADEIFYLVELFELLDELYCYK